MLSWISNYIGGPTILMFIAALIGAAGALWAAREQTVSERELKRKNEEIVELSRQIAYSLTGGNSYCYLAFSLPDKNGATARLSIVHAGQFPLYDVRVRFLDLDKFEIYVNSKAQSSGKITYGDLEKAELDLNIGNLNPSQAYSLGDWPMPQSGEARYNVFFSARNGLFTELVRIKRIDGKWVSAYRVKRSQGDNLETLYEKIDPAFPRDKDGKVSWD